MTTRNLYFGKFGQVLTPEPCGYGNPAMRVQPRPFGSVLGDTMSRLGRTWRPLLSTALIVFVPLGMVTLIVFNATDALAFLDVVLNDPESLDKISREDFLELAEPFFWAVGIAVAIQSVGSLYVYLVSHDVVAGDIEDRTISGRAARRRAASRFGTALVAAIIVSAAIALLFGVGLSIWLIPYLIIGTPNAASALVALVLLAAVAAPAIWLAVSFSMITSVIAIEGLGPFGSLKRSFRLVRRRWWPTLGYLLLVGLIGSVAAQLIQILAIPLTLLGDAASGFSIASLFGIAFQGVLVAGIGAMYTGWYVDLRSRVEDLSTENLR